MRAQIVSVVAALLKQERTSNGAILVCIVIAAILGPSASRGLARMIRSSVETNPPSGDG